METPHPSLLAPQHARKRSLTRRLFGTSRRPCGLTVGHENHAILPIEILDAHAVEFTLVSHSCIAHQDDDVAEKLKRPPSPSAVLAPSSNFLSASSSSRRCRPRSFLIVILGAWPIMFHCLRFVKHSSQCPQSAVGICGRARKSQLLDAIACDPVHSHLHNRRRLQHSPAVTVELSSRDFVCCGRS